MEIKIARNILDGNDAIARRNRELFSKNGVFVLNVMSSPGAGKTTLLEKTLTYLMPEINSAVIVGDICTSNDAKRLARSGAPVVQINTDAYGGNCHLTAQFIENAATDLDLSAMDLLIVENVGNLVCPAEFDVGEDARMVVLSVTEGEDKPVKYPVMFRKCHVAVINKIDLLPYIDCKKEDVVQYILQVHPEMPIFELSATKEMGFGPWIQWLKNKIHQKRSIII
jgi:hydrogenase nickel incorporation protein HypB